MGDFFNDESGYFGANVPDVEARLRNHRKFRVGDRVVVLSIQGNPGAYCTPRENLPELSMYHSLELAMWYDDDDAWLTPADLGIEGPGLPSWEREHEVGAYIPADEVKALADALREMGKQIEQGPAG